MEKIEIRAKEIFEVEINDKNYELAPENQAYHLYIVYTDTTGTEYILRGGPESDFFTSDIAIVGADTSVEYNLANKDIHKDLDNDGNDFSIEITSGTDLSQEFADMQARGQAINSAGYEYELINQNSNTVVFDMVSAAGLTPVLPTNTATGQPVNAPAATSTLTHSPVDEFLDWMGDLFDAETASPTDISLKIDNENPTNFHVLADDELPWLDGVFGENTATITGDTHAVPDGNGGTQATLVEDGATIQHGSATYNVSDVNNSLRSAADAVADFVTDQVESGIEWFGDNANVIFSQWFTDNLADIIDGTLDADDALIDLALHFGTARGISYIGTLDTVQKANDFIEEILRDEFGVSQDSAEIITDGFGKVLVAFGAAVIDSNGWNSTDHVNAGVSALTAVVANEYATREFGRLLEDGTYQATPLSNGAAAGLTSVISTAITSDLFSGYDSGDWVRFGSQTAIATIAGSIGGVPGAVFAVVASKILGSILGGKTFYAGEFGSAQQVLDSIYQVQQIDDGQGGTIPALVAVNAQGSTIIAQGITTVIGGSGQDVLVGTDNDDSITGNAGSDYLEGRDGDDTLVGEVGSDHLSGGNGDDFLSGGAGDDIVFGDAGNDTAVGDAGEEFIHLGAGNDVAFGGDGRDLIMGAAGADTIESGAGNDLVDGGAGNDAITTEAGDDLAFGGLGNDVIALGDDDDLALGDAGNDQIFGGSGDDIVLGGAGVDILHGDNGADILSGDAGQDMLEGGLGDDVLSGGADDDTLLGGMDNDLLAGDKGDDTLRGGFGDDLLQGGTGGDTLEGDDGDDSYFISDDAADIANIITDNAGADDAVVLSWLLEANIGNLTLTRTGDDLEIAYNAATLVTVVDHFNGKAVETLEIEQGKTLDIGSLAGGAGVLVTPAVVAGSGTSRQATLDARVVTMNAAINTAEQFFDNTLSQNLADAAYEELLAAQVATEEYNGDDIASFSRDRGACGGGYTVYKLDQIASLSGTDALSELEELSPGYNPADFTQVVANADKVTNSYAVTYEVNSFESVAATATVVDYYDGTERVATLLTITQNSSSAVLESSQIAEGDAVLPGGTNVTAATRQASGTTTQVDLGITALQTGVDKLVGAWWNEVLVGQSGSDILVGNGGDDTLDGGSGNDWIFGGDGDDTAYGRAGDDIIFGGDGDDALEGNEQEDAIIGGAGNDIVYGNDGDDWLEGSAGDDTIDGGEGSDIIYGGDGNDVIHAGIDIAEFSLSLYNQTVNTTVTDDQLNPDATALANGNYVVTWLSTAGSAPQGVYVQLFDANANKIGTEILVANTTGLTWAYTQNTPQADPGFYDPRITQLPDGGFVVAYVGDTGSDGSGHGVYLQRYDMDGATVGSAQLVNSTTAANQWKPDIEALGDGSFVAIWRDDSGADGFDSGMFGQRFDVTATKVGSEFQINTQTFGPQYNGSVAALSDGGFVVTWDSNLQDGSGQGVYGQRFDTSATKVGSEFLVNSHTAGSQFESSVDGLAGGGFVVAWRDASGQQTGTDDVFAQLYDASGNTIGNEFRVNDYGPVHQFEPHVLGLKDGTFIISWTSGVDASGVYDFDIVMKRYDALGNVMNSEIFPSSGVGAHTEDARLIQLEDGDVVLVSSKGIMADHDILLREYVQSSIADTHLIDGGSGNDTVTGDRGDDVLLGGVGDDVIWSGAGADTVEGGAGNDFLYGQHGVDTMHGNEGNDQLFGGIGNDQLYGDSGNDVIHGEFDNDVIYGGNGGDGLYGGDGMDTLYGEAGDDTLSGHEDNDVIYGGDGVDVIIGGTGNDALFGDAGNDNIIGGTGADSLYGGADNDMLSGYEGDDLLIGDAGDDILYGNGGIDTLTGGTGSDTFHFDSLTESVDTARDTITDFVQGTDLIDLGGLGFTAIANGAGGGTTLGYSQNAGNTIIADAGSNFSIELTGVINLDDNDFVWS